jgi:hypothetical protein
MQAYSNPKRESEAHALPNVEVFEAEYCTHSCCGAIADADGIISHSSDCTGDRAWAGGEPRLKRGFWHWPCFPDGNPIGPFATEAEALADAQSGTHADCETCPNFPHGEDDVHAPECPLCDGDGCVSR